MERPSWVPNSDHIVECSPRPGWKMSWPAGTRFFVDLKAYKPDDVIIFVEEGSTTPHTYTVRDSGNVALIIGAKLKPIVQAPDEALRTGESLSSMGGW